MKVFLAVFAVSFASAGCAINTVYEADRQLQEQNRDAAAQIGAAVPGITKAIEDAKPLVKSSADPAAPAVAAELEGLASALALVGTASKDIKANSDQELKNWGPAKTSKPYSPANSDSSRKDSDKAHTTPWYWHWATWALGAAGFALTAAKIAATYFPVIGEFLSGPIGQLAKLALQKMTDLKAKADAAPDDMLHRDDIQMAISDIATTPAVQTVASKFLGATHLDSLLHGQLGSGGDSGGSAPDPKPDKAPLSTPPAAAETKPS